MIGRRLGPYEVLAKLGEGGMGAVYRARDTKLGREVALKVLPELFATDPDRLARFEREAKTLAAINHPHIAQILHLEQHEQTSALVMELVEGEDLSARIARGPIPLEEALPIARQIAEALEAAHEQGIVHRDLKPANIKVRPDGTVKVLDFGLAKALEPTAASAAGVARENSPTITSPAQMTGIGVILGTAAYMAPEQARGRAVDKRADIWAFGCVLYEMLTGARPFDGETVTDVLGAVVRAEPDWSRLPDGTPRDIRRLLRRCLTKDARARQQAAGDARLEIEESLAGASSDGPPPQVPATWRRVAAAAIGAALVATVAAGLASWRFLRPTPEPRPLMRLDVALASDAIEGERITLAISPDGTRIVFPIRTARGTRMLGTRLLADTEAAALAGTENGVDPFFSPDGQWVAFHADDAIKKVAIGGGAPVTIAATNGNVRGASWGPDGSIVAGLHPNSGLFVVPSQGGTPQPLTTLPAGELTHRWPQHLPGGRSVLFTASPHVVRFEDAAIQVVSLESGAVKTLVTGGHFGRYMGGHLTWLHQGVLHAVPFDLTTLEMRGTPVAVLADVAGIPLLGAGEFDASSTGTFVYRRARADSVEYPVLWLEPGGRVTPLLNNPARYVTPRLSPDGRRLAVSIVTGKVADLQVYDIQRETLSRLTFDAGDNVEPVWAPDGRHLAYLAMHRRSIMWLRTDGAGEPQVLLAGERLLSRQAAGITPFSFSPDGRHLLFRAIGAGGQGGRNDVYVLPLDLSDPDRPKAGDFEPLIATPASESDAVVSPDGRWVAYVSDESGQDEVYVRPFRPGRGGQWQVSVGGGENPRWGADGRNLYFIAPDRRIMTAQYAVAEDSFTPGKPRAWSDVLVRTMDVAPQGNRFVVLPSDAQPGALQRTFLLNFFDELHRRTARP